MLSGLLFDETGEALIAVHSRKGTRRYGYYVSRSAHHRDANTTRPAIRLPATDIEQLVCSELGQLLSKPLDLLAQSHIDVAPSRLETVLEACSALAIRMKKRDRALVRKLLEKVTVNPDAVEIGVLPVALAGLLALPEPADPTALIHCVEVRLTRTGRALRLVDNSGSTVAEGTPDETLARLVVRARTWWATLEQAGQTVTELAASEGVTASYLTRVLRLAFLSPEVMSAVLSGSLRAGVDASHLFSAVAINRDWTEQRCALLPWTVTNAGTSNLNTRR
jgi:hypothetical protein